jgi:hypothetical protein
VATDLFVFKLLQWKHAIALEAKGMKHSSGRSVRKMACEFFKLPLRTKHALVIERINLQLEEWRKQDAKSQAG